MKNDRQGLENLPRVFFSQDWAKARVQMCKENENEIREVRA